MRNSRRLRIGKGFLFVVLVAALGVFLSTSTTFTMEEPKSIPWEDTGPFTKLDDTGDSRLIQELLRHQRNQIRRGISVSTGPSTNSEDVGDVAVIVDNGDILIPPKPANPLDLADGTGIALSPTAGGFDVSAPAPATLDPGIGAALSLTDDDSEEVLLLAAFPFLGTSYSSVFVNSDGNITLGAGDSASTARNASRHIGGPPRVSPLFADLNPDSGGTVNADVRADRLVVTWSAVPEFGTTNSNTFQTILHTSGAIEFVYDSLDAEFAVVGVAEGNGTGPINEIDLTQDLPGSFAAGAIFEEFSPGIAVQQMDVVELAKEFYKTHDDKYDFLVMFTDAVVDIGFGAFAFELTVQNHTTGIGLNTFNVAPLVGSAGELESIVNMNRIGLYWPDARKMVNPPIKKFHFAPGALDLVGPPGPNQNSQRARWFGTYQGDFGAHGSYTLGLNSAMSLMAQEAGHRWMAFVPFVHPTKGVSFDSLDLLGRDFAHWSFFFNARVPAGQFGGDPRASGMEGNAILDLGPEASEGFPFPCDDEAGESTFLTEPNELTDGYTELDQYLMGLREDDDVNSFWYVDEPRSVNTGDSVEGARFFPAVDDIIYCGKRVDLEVEDIQNFPGAGSIPPVGMRTPALGDETDEDEDGNPEDDVKTMAFILLLEQGPVHS
ncbi:MAG: hypothetical protein ACE5Q6_04950, partial [Dehalococcoidia bacterium]